MVKKKRRLIRLDINRFNVGLRPRMSRNGKAAVVRVVLCDASCRCLNKFREWEIYAVNVLIGRIVIPFSYLRLDR